MRNRVLASVLFGLILGIIVSYSASLSFAALLRVHAASCIHLVRRDLGSFIWFNHLSPTIFSTATLEANNVFSTSWIYIF